MVSTFQSNIGGWPKEIFSEYLQYINHMTYLFVGVRVQWDFLLGSDAFLI